MTYSKAKPRKDANNLMAPVILVDVSNLAFRSGHAFPNLSHEGQLTGAIYGTLKTILELRKKISTRMIFAWDHGVPVVGATKPANWRDKVVAGYKATRHSDPNVVRGIVKQMLDVSTALKLLGYCSVSVSGLEADDVIGILACELPCDIRIFSNDKDFYQLLDHRVAVIPPKQLKGEYQTLRAADVEAEYGVPIHRWGEYLALGGDTADNIHSIPGVGPKTAAKLLAAGVDLNKHQSKQPLEFWAKYGVYWPQIQQSYYAARIPTYWTDPRIAECVRKAGGIPQYHTDQLAKNREQRLEKFTTFLADRNMESLISVRHEYFSDRRAAACNNPSQPQPAPAKKPKQVPLF